MWNLRFFDQFSRKKSFSVFCGGNHQKRLNFLFFAWNLYCCFIYNLWNKKPKCNIWRPCQKSIQYPLPLTYVIMKTMRSPGYHHNGFVATHELGHMMYSYTLLVPMNQRVLNKPSKEHNISGHKWYICIYKYINSITAASTKNN